MNAPRKDLHDIVDRGLASVRRDQPDDATVREATARVWNAIAAAPVTAASPESHHERIQGCADFQTLIPMYLDGALTGARALLLEDHTRECLPCRKALRASRSGEASKPSLSKLATPRRGWRHVPVARRAIAAALVLGFGVLPVALYSHYSGSVEASEVRLESASGPVYLISDGEMRAIATGERVRGGRIRVGRDSGAVVALSDGSRVELNERAEFAVSGSGSDVTLRLLRGDAVVRATADDDGKLFVAAPDCMVTGTGATFALAAGTKGSRVTAFDGTVTVDNGGSARAIHAGEQLATSPAVFGVPAAQTVAWSQNSAKYVGLLGDVANLRRDIDSRVAMPGVRYSTRLLDRVPAGTVFYAAIPNLAPTLRDAERILEERLGQNPALRAWWQTRNQGDRGVGEALDGVREFGPFLGSEIVVAVSGDVSNGPERFTIIGDLADPAGFRQMLVSGAASRLGGAVALVDDLSAERASETKDTLFVHVAGDVFVAASSVDALRRASGNESSAFVGTPFHSRIAELYRDGVGFVVAADLARIVPSMLSESKKDDAGSVDAMQRLGVTNLRTFIAEQKTVDGRGITRAALVFDEAARGIPAWLAAPGPMGALDFISPDASVVAAFVVEDPSALADDLFESLGAVDANFFRVLQEFQQQHGIDLRQDFVAPLGGEFAFAVDGPVLPTPSWKLVFEVDDPARLQATIERAVNEVNVWATANGKPSLAFEGSESNGRTYYTLSMGGGLAQMTYTFVGGYLVAAPSRALVDNAIRYRDSGYTLQQSARFRSALPADSNLNVSALFYQDLAPLVGPLVDRYKNSEALSAEQRQALGSFASSSSPSLMCAYADQGRIVVACNSDQGPLGLSPSTLVGVPGSFEMRHVLEEGLNR